MAGRAETSYDSMRCLTRYQRYIHAIENERGDDALCIVQDDEVEWQSEAVQMSKIYQGSQLIITATQSASSSHGCFHSDDRSDGDLFFRTRTSPSDGRVSLVCACDSNIRTRATVDSLISTRGWTLQEQLLSSRVLFFMDADIHWQCQACYQTQSGVSFNPRETATNVRLFIPNHDHQLDDASHQRLWQRIASDYSGRKFTYPRDRVPALAGICQTFASAQDDASILGLWSKSFARDLSWLRGYPRLHMRSVSGLPIWTWLPCPGSIMYLMDFSYENLRMKTVDYLHLVSWAPAVAWHAVRVAGQVGRSTGQRSCARDSFDFIRRGGSLQPALSSSLG